VTIIRQQYGIELPEEEAGNIAFHLVNGQSEGDDVAQTMQSVKMLKDIFNLVQYHFKQQIDTESINYSRFLVHMQFSSSVYRRGAGRRAGQFSAGAGD
jgi:beta-glucoside operon transcriptional antiterminator